MKDRANFNTFFQNYAELGYAIDKFHGKVIVMVMRSLPELFCMYLIVLNTTCESRLIDLYLTSIIEDCNLKFHLSMTQMMYLKSQY